MATSEMVHRDASSAPPVAAKNGATPMSTKPFTPISTNQFVPARSGINLRLVMFIVLVSAPFVWCSYIGLRYVMNNGIEDHGEYKKVDLKALGFFNFDQANGTINDVPPQFRALDGKKVMLEGFMWSPTSATRLHDFQFVYNVQKCCFNGPPLVQERVFVSCPAGKSIPYVDNYMKMIGTLHVDVKKVDGVITSVYTMDVERGERV